MDNRVFNINGSGKAQLGKAIELVFAQKGANTTARSWSVSKKGLILRWIKAEDNKRAQNFLTDLDAETATIMAWNWLKEAKPENFDMTGSDANADHDGSNSLGWRVYVEDWGQVDDDFYAICAIKPAYLWHGK